MAATAAATPASGGYTSAHAPGAGASAESAPVVKGVVSVESAFEFDRLVERSQSSQRLLVVFFWADFHEPSRPGGQMDTLFTQLAVVHNDCLFAKIDAEREATDAVTDRFVVDVVPTFVFLKGTSILTRVEGADTKQLASNIESLKTKLPTVAGIVGARSTALGGSAGDVGPGALLSSSPSSSSSSSSSSSPSPSSSSSSSASSAPALSPELTRRLERLVNAMRVMLFMKGSPQDPKCKFSREMVSVLVGEGVQFGSFDILTDDEVRQGLKVFSSWPTYPQLYLEGKLVGGLDVVKEMREDGSLRAVLCPVAPVVRTVEERCRELVNRSVVMLFMKGTPDAPRCGFSARMVELLRKENIEFESFDILADEEVRQGLKEFSKWPTYPQLFVRGRLVGGLDVVTEMATEGDESLAEQLGVEAKEPLEAKLTRLLHQKRVMLFMKGTPDAPRCGFSAQAVEVLRAAGITDYGSFDILTDDEVRQGLKEFSKWPTYPQLYIDGSLVGGLDVMKELHEAGELVVPPKEV